MSQTLIVQSLLKFFRVDLTEGHQAMLDDIRSSARHAGEAEWYGLFFRKAEYPAKAWWEEEEIWPEDNSLAGPDEDWCNMLVPFECYTLYETDALPAEFAEPWEDFIADVERFPPHFERRKTLIKRAFRRALFEAVKRGDNRVEVQIDTSDIEGQPMDWDRFADYLRSRTF